jgi:hypothetical protein
MTVITNVFVMDRGRQIGGIYPEGEDLPACIGLTEVHPVAIEAILIAGQRGFQGRNALYLMAAVTLRAGRGPGALHDKGVVRFGFQFLIRVAGPA